ncbi:MAG: cell division protein FtsQ/DivIB [Polyangiaceae bacterium]
MSSDTSRVRTALGVAIVIASSVALAWVARQHILESPRFAIARVDVAGCSHRSADAVIAESGLALGSNVFAADLDEARAKLLTDPWIADAALCRRLPGTILVRITERKAAALVVLGDTFLATPEGEPFKKVDSDDPVDLPLVTGVTVDDLLDDREGALQTIRRAVALADEYEERPLAKRSEIEEVHVEPNGSFSLVIGRGATQLALGSPPFRRKLDQATRVIAELDKRGVKASAILLDNAARSDRVVVRLRR